LHGRVVVHIGQGRQPGRASKVFGHCGLLTGCRGIGNKSGRPARILDRWKRLIRLTREDANDVTVHGATRALDPYPFDLKAPCTRPEAIDAPGIAKPTKVPGVELYRRSLHSSAQCKSKRPPQPIFDPRHGRAVGRLRIVVRHQVNEDFKWKGGAGPRHSHKDAPFCLFVKRRMSAGHLDNSRGKAAFINALAIWKAFTYRMFVSYVQYHKPRRSDLMDYFYKEIGVPETWVLFASTFALIAAAHYMSFRQALKAEAYDWRNRPLRSVLSLAIRHELFYVKHVPVLIGSVLALVTVTLAL